MKIFFKKTHENIVGILSAIGLTLNTLIVFPVIMSFIIFRLLTWGKLKVWFRKISFKIAGFWVSFNTWWLRILHKKDWSSDGDMTGISKDNWYVIISNHKSWADIVILQALFNKKAPMLKFFIKKQLFWIPLMGIVWWGLEFPFMNRYSKEKLLKNPKLKGKDLAQARKMNEKSKEFPVSIFNFPEGTRYSKDKAELQNTPYKHLLIPKAGGIAMSIKVLNERIQDLVDVTLVYGNRFKNKPVNLWDFLCGRVVDVKIKVTKYTLPSWIKNGDYEKDVEFKKKFQQWLADIWQEKDNFLDKCIKQEIQNTENAN